MMNPTEALEADNALKYPRYEPGTPKEEYSAKVQDYYEARSEISGQFRDWLADQYASEFPEEVQGMIFGKAWEDGHSSGYHEVEGHYAELAEFTEKVRLAFQK